MVFDNLLTTTGLAAAGTAILAGWQHIKSFSRYIIGIFLLQKSLHSEIARPVALHLRQRYWRLPSGIGTYTSLKEVIDDKQYRSTIPYEMPNNATVWFGPRGGFLVSADGTSITSLRKFSDPEGLVCDALDDEDARVESSMSLNSGNYYVVPVIGSVGRGIDFGSDNRPQRKNQTAQRVGEDSDALDALDSNRAMTPHRMVDVSFRYAKERYMQNQSNKDPMRGLFYSEEIIKLIADLKRWYLQRSWYQNRGIPWRTGVLLHGPGGTGKSSLAKAMAQTLGIPLYQYYLNTLTDRDFVEKWGEMNTPCVVALEDFDTVFHGRESVTTHQSLSFECVLNQISGISALNGVLLIVTTNHVEHIDAALGQIDSHGRPTRPGRIDRIVYMGVTTLEQRQDIAAYTLDWATDMVAKLVAEGEGTTAAQFSDMCANAALELLSKEDSNEVQKRISGRPQDAHTVT